MENFWMYQVEKLEEEQAKQEQQTEQHDGDEVWTVFSLGMLCICSISENKFSCTCGEFRIVRMQQFFSFQRLRMVVSLYYELFFIS